MACHCQGPEPLACHWHHGLTASVQVALGRSRHWIPNDRCLSRGGGRRPPPTDATASRRPRPQPDADRCLRWQQLQAASRRGRRRPVADRCQPPAAGGADGQCLSFLDNRTCSEPAAAAARLPAASAGGGQPRTASGRRGPGRREMLELPRRQDSLRLADEQAGAPAGGWQLYASTCRRAAAAPASSREVRPPLRETVKGTKDGHGLRDTF